MIVTVYTQAYNAEKYISKCVESVLNQTFLDFEYILIDNGSNDNTRNIIKNYADKDNRVVPIFYDKNIRGLLAKHRDDFNGEFYTVLDADDWIEPDYLERLLKVAKDTGADIINTGSVLFEANNCEIRKENLDQRLFLENKDYAIAFPNLHWYYRQNWGMIAKTELIKMTSFPDLDKLGIPYGGDTIFSIRLLNNSKSICIDNSALHHYRIHSSSISHKFDPRRSFADYYLFNDAISFLKNYGSVSKRNYAFLCIIYSIATIETLNVVSSADVEENDKIAEVEKIMKRDVTEKSFVFSMNQCEFVASEFGKNISERFSENRVLLIAFYFRFYLNSSKHSISVHDMMVSYTPKCACIISEDVIHVFLKEKTLADALAKDDTIQLSYCFSKMLIENKLDNKINWSDIIRRLQADNPIASKVSTCDFIRRYFDVYNDVIYLNYRSALEKMNCIIDRSANEITEEFIWLYLTLAAQLNCVDEFLYGKLISAGFYLKCNRFEESRTAINDLAEMGVEDNDEILRIKSELNKVGK